LEAERTAVPIATNSATDCPQAYIFISMRTPTMPSARSSSASASIRRIASSRALYIASVRTVSSCDCPQRATWIPMW
jgi:hypothetical protein